MFFDHVLKVSQMLKGPLIVTSLFQGLYWADKFQQKPGQRCPLQAPWRRTNGRVGVVRSAPFASGTPQAQEHAAGDFLAARRARGPRGVSGASQPRLGREGGPAGRGFTQGFHLGRDGLPLPPGARG